MSKGLSLLDNANLQLPAHLQGKETGLSEGLMSGIGGIAVNRIGVKGSRFRQEIRGEEVGVWDENYLDVIFVKVQPKVSRKFYAGKYDAKAETNAPPTCYSVDGVVPAEDVHNKQSTACDTCPQNVKGSKMGDDGNKGRACGFFRRLAVRLAEDETNTIYRLDVAAMGLFGDSHPKEQKYSLNEYAKALKNRSLDPGQIVTRLSFDTDQSVPKLLFQPLRFISELDQEMIEQLNETPAEIEQYVEVKFNTAATETDDAPPAPAPAAAKPKPKPAPKAAPVVEEEEEVEEVAPPAAAKPKPAAPKPVPAKAPAPAATAPKPAAPKPKAAAPAPAVQESADDEIDDILAGLDL